MNWPEAQGDASSKAEVTMRGGTQHDGEMMMLDRIRATLQARAEGRKEGGDVVIMRLVDKIVEREAIR